MNWGALFQLLTALGAVIAAIASWRAAAAMREAAVGQLLNDLIKEYKTDEFRDALRRLRVKASSPDQFAEEWCKAWKQGDKEAIANEDARYTINAYFSRVASLKRAGFLSQEALRVILKQRGIAIWYRVVEPMTKKIDPDIADSPFEELRKEWRQHGSKSPLALPGGCLAGQVAPSGDGQPHG
jgi:hypothetical protein